MPKTEA